jgi:hypothetical protein
MDNFGKGSKLPSLLTLAPPIMKTGNHSEYEICGKTAYAYLLMECPEAHAICLEAIA